MKYYVKILSQGQPKRDLKDYLQELGDSHVELLTSPTNLGCGGGRLLLAGTVTSPFTMMLDDDMYLTESSIPNAMKVFEQNEQIGAVSMPSCDLSGRMVSPGGSNIIIRSGVVYRMNPRLNLGADWIEVNDLDGGAMLYRTKMRESFTWDPDASGFDDLDKSLSIMRDGRWKQAIVPKGRLIHDRSWVGVSLSYERIRHDGLSWRRAYRYFRNKWGLRVDLRNHLLIELIFPTLTLIHSPLIFRGFNKFVETRGKRALWRHVSQTAN